MTAAELEFQQIIPNWTTNMLTAELKGLTDFNAFRTRQHTHRETALIAAITAELNSRTQ